MKVQNVSPYGALEVPGLRVAFGPGEVKEVPDEIGAALIQQSDNFKQVAPVAAKKGE